MVDDRDSISTGKESDADGVRFEKLRDMIDDNSDYQESNHGSSLSKTSEFFAGQNELNISLLDTTKREFGLTYSHAARNAFAKKSIDRAYEEKKHSEDSDDLLVTYQHPKKSKLSL
jgi:hypothetical protein